MPVGTLKQILPQNKNETIFSIIAFLAGVLVSCMFLKKKNELLEGGYHDRQCEGYTTKNSYGY